MKVISYSLFKGGDPLAELFYVRGLYFNVLMNGIVYPGWQTYAHIDFHISAKYPELLKLLTNKYGAIMIGADGAEPHCHKMLWRMYMVFWKDVDYLICRDTDALTSMREAIAVEAWVRSGEILHGIHDNPAHSIPLLGGMCGFKCQPLREKYESYKNMVAAYPGTIDKHGSDQKFLNAVIYEDFKSSYRCDEKKVIDASYDTKTGIAVVDYTDTLGQKKHGSDLCTSFIGAAGTNEMETLRFFRGHLPDWGSDKELWSKYPKLFYWA